MLGEVVTFEAPLVWREREREEKREVEAEGSCESIVVNRSRHGLGISDGKGRVKHCTYTTPDVAGTCHLCVLLHLLLLHLHPCILPLVLLFLCHLPQFVPPTRPCLSVQHPIVFVIDILVVDDPDPKVEEDSQLFTLTHGFPDKKQSPPPPHRYRSLANTSNAALL